MLLENKLRKIKNRMNELNALYLEGKITIEEDIAEMRILAEKEKELRRTMIQVREEAIIKAKKDNLFIVYCSSQPKGG